MDIENAMADSGKTYGGQSYLKPLSQACITLYLLQNFVCIFNKNNY